MLLIGGWSSVLRIWRKAPLTHLGLGGALFFASMLNAGAKEKWQKATPAELANLTPTLEADAAAEALLWKIKVDDSRFPESRTVNEYIRYKVFDPQRADHLMRLSQQSVSYGRTELRDAEISACLTLPDGTTKEFGSESVKERTIVKKAGAESLIQQLFGASGLEMKERFLAVGTVLPGSVVEVRISVKECYPELASFRLLQMNEVPVHKLEYLHTPVSETRFSRSLTVLNSKLVEWKENKRTGEISVWANNLPSIKEEPFDGGTSYYAATTVLSYTQLKTISSKAAHQHRLFGPDRPWAPIATVLNWTAEDHITVTRKVKKTAEELTKDAGSDLEKAQRIHNYVQKLFMQFARQVEKNRVVMMEETDRVSMDDVIDFEQTKPDQLLTSDFLWLAASLYRAAGFRAEVLMLPDRSVAPFARNIPSRALLPRLCIALYFGGSWHYSLLNSQVPTTFDELPWENQGFGGLLALDSKEEFIDVPFSTASQSRITNAGTLQLESDGTLSGSCQIAFTGHDATRVRYQLQGQTAERQTAVAEKNLQEQFAPADVSTVQIENVEDFSKPLKISFSLRWPGYATIANDRLIFRPFVFRANEQPPFASAERRNALYLPYKHTETDTIILSLPKGYETEAKEAPPSNPGEILSYEIQIGYNHKTHALHIQRDFASSLISANATTYPIIKRWYDAINTCDKYSLVLKKSEGSALVQPTASSPQP